MSTLKITPIESSLMPAGRYCIGDLSDILPERLHRELMINLKSYNTIAALKNGKMKSFHIFYDVVLEDGKITPFFLCNSEKNHKENELCDEEIFEYNMDCGSLGIVELVSPSVIKVAEENCKKGLVQIVDVSFDFKVEREVLEKERIYHFGDVKVLVCLNDDKED